MVHYVRLSLHLLQSEHEGKICMKRRITREDPGRIGFASVFACLVCKNSKTPKLSPMADNTITLGGK